MGHMYVYRCMNCGDERYLMSGIGMTFPSLCQEVMEDIASGAYGPRLKKAYKTCSLPAVCAEEKLYVCKGCGRWKLTPDATLYEPLDVDSVLDERFGDKTVRELGHVPYLMPNQLKSCRVVSAYEPACKCGSMMSEIKLRKGLALACPTCGVPNGLVELVGFWD
ncbi:MAG: hypothetical protein IJ203_02220 [Atopobiaceae bacterium]|nr:hypothetical protein [Atopobiaceae bacterium]